MFYFFLLLLFLLNNQRRCQEKLQQATYKTQGLWLEHKHVPGPTSDDRAGQQAMQNTIGWLQIQMHNVDRTTDLRHHSDHRLGRALSSASDNTQDLDAKDLRPLWSEAHRTHR